MIRFHPRVALTNSTGSHIRYLPGTLAGAMCDLGAAAPQATAGKIRVVSLLQPASTHAERIGGPSQFNMGVRFVRWVRLDASASRIIEHHPRATDYS